MCVVKKERLKVISSIFCLLVDLNMLLLIILLHLTLFVCAHEGMCEHVCVGMPSSAPLCLCPSVCVCVCGVLVHIVLAHT